MGLRAAVQEKDKTEEEKTKRHRDQEPHGGGGSLTASNDHAVTSITQVVLETSTGHAVAESQSPANRKEKAHCCNTGSQRPRSSAVLRGGLEVPEEASAEW